MADQGIVLKNIKASDIVVLNHTDNHKNTYIVYTGMFENAEKLNGVKHIQDREI